MALQQRVPKPELWKGFSGAPTAAKAAVGYLSPLPGPSPGKAPGGRPRGLGPRVRRPREAEGTYPPLGLEALSPVYLRFQEGALRGNPGGGGAPKRRPRAGPGRRQARLWGEPPGQSAPGPGSPSTPEGVVYAPFHFAEAPANRLTLDAIDPISRIPEYKVSAVRLEKAD